eukprot:m.77720 g.77720  ORF g.77720 m.77720 type:complete len:69 (+) comp8551_c0_seq1:1895-2101(+)
MYSTNSSLSSPLLIYSSKISPNFNPNVVFLYCFEYFFSDILDAQQLQHQQQKGRTQSTNATITTTTFN